MSFQKSYSPSVQTKANLVNGFQSICLYGLLHTMLKKKKTHMPLSCSGFTIKLPLEHVGYDDCLQCLNDITKCYAQTDGLMLHSERRA